MPVRLLLSACIYVSSYHKHLVLRHSKEIKTRNWEERWSMSDRCKPHAFRTISTAKESSLRVSITTKPRHNPLPSSPEQVSSLFSHT